ncbi:hypothetical protein C7B61_14720 [filamentous cyanobacterium CCP1]|nr:hypothetical protein C7B61_14720 [filamentous cyanobacterium CCP1]
MAQQSHLVHSFGGHPMAMGLSLPVENIPMFTEAIDRQLREQESQSGIAIGAVLQVDLTITVADLGKELFRELKLLEPYGMGNPVPKLLIQNCWFKNASNRNIQDWKGQKIRYIKTEFELWDESVQQGFPGVWWEHYRDELPLGRCDAIVELDFNTYKKRYEARLIALRSVGAQAISVNATIDWIVDRRGEQEPFAVSETAVRGTRCPTNWSDLLAWVRQVQPGQQLVLDYSLPLIEPPQDVWQRLIGIAKYLSRTEKQATRTQLQEKLGIGDRPLQFGFRALQQLGFHITSSEAGFQMNWQAIDEAEPQNGMGNEAIGQFLSVVQEEQFQRRYFYEVPLPMVCSVVMGNGNG